MVGMFVLMAPIIIPGSILSQLAISTSPSNLYACVVSSIESAIISLLGNGVSIPSCPIAIPSHNAIVLNSSPNPPLSVIPFFTSSANLSKCT